MEAKKADTIKPVLIHLHLYYTDMFSSLIDCISNINVEYELFVTLVKDDADVKSKILEFNPNAKLFVLENKGYDIAPFIYVINSVCLDNYSYVIKLHTKRDVEANVVLASTSLGGSIWRDCLLDFVSTKDKFKRSLAFLEKNKSVAMLSHWKLIIEECFHINTYCMGSKLIDFLVENNIQIEDFKFVAGTMFIARACIFKKLQALGLGFSDFEDIVSSGGDGQFAHILERVFGALVYDSGFSIEDAQLDVNAEELCIVSCVKDKSVFNKFHTNNKFNKGADFVVFEKYERNMPALYNKFLDEYDYSKGKYFVFCREDWQIKEDWASRLSELDKDNLYAPSGVKDNIEFGETMYSYREGIACFQYNGFFLNESVEVETIDTPCIIVHSSLIKKFNLRFDEKLNSALCVSDFAINAKKAHEIKSMAWQLKCHYRPLKEEQEAEKMLEKEQLVYLRNKYRDIAKYCHFDFFYDDVYKKSCIRAVYSTQNMKARLIWLIKFIFRFSYSPRKFREFISADKCLRANNFDINYYLATNTDVEASGVNPAKHYLSSGWKEGRSPSRMFKKQLVALVNYGLTGGVNVNEYLNLLRFFNDLLYFNLQSKKMLIYFDRTWDGAAQVYTFNEIEVDKDKHIILRVQSNAENYIKLSYYYKEYHGVCVLCSFEALKDILLRFDNYDIILDDVEDCQNDTCILDLIRELEEIKNIKE